MVTRLLHRREPKTSTFCVSFTTEGKKKELKERTREKEKRSSPSELPRFLSLLAVSLSPGFLNLTEGEETQE